jgi:predicted alternative tryptophan synthase beta-subunit
MSGLEARKQLELVDDYLDEAFAPCGGGSNFGGIAFPFFADKAAGRNVHLVAVEPTSCPREFMRAACATTGARRW